MLSTRPAFAPSVCEKTAKFSTADSRLPRSAASRPRMSPVRAFRLESVPEISDVLSSSSVLIVPSVRERSPTTCENFCLKNSSSDPAMSISPRLRPERSVSPFSR